VKRRRHTGEIAGASPRGPAYGRSMTTSRIDVHHHYVTGALIDALAEVGIHYVGGQPLAATRLEDSLAVMDRYEIASALLSVPIPLTVRDAGRVARSLNEAGAAAVGAAPGRFGLLAALPLPDVDAALAELAYGLETLRADGVLLLSNYAGVYPGDPRLESIFAELDRQAAVVLLHPAVSTGDRLPIEPDAGSPVPKLEPSLLEFPFDTTRAAANLILSGTLERYPNIQVILAHAGGTVPYMRDRIVKRGPILERVRRTPPPTPAELQELLRQGLAESRRQLQRLFYDVTLSANETVLGCLGELVASTQILLGTDYPFAQEIGITTTLAGLERQPSFADDARSLIEGGNARRLFPRLSVSRRWPERAARRVVPAPAGSRALRPNG
jgi:6-methylsalicylate decarboxylase